MFLCALKAVAMRAGISDIGLHKFRETFAITQHKAGVDARTKQKRLGHSLARRQPWFLEGED